jgi:uncharacterized protein (TIGR03066 family)
MSFFAPARFFALLFAFSLACGTSVAADEDLAKRLTGSWLETRFETRSKQVKESDNLVTFAADGTMKLHLKKGEAKDNRSSMDGTWKVESGGALKMEIVVGDKKQEQSMQLSFEGDEMILTDADGRRTWHKRHEGPLPDRYQ